VAQSRKPRSLRGPQAPPRATSSVAAGPPMRLQLEAPHRPPRFIGGRPRRARGRGRGRTAARRSQSDFQAICRARDRGSSGTPLKAGAAWVAGKIFIRSLGEILRQRQRPFWFRPTVHPPPAWMAEPAIARGIRIGRGSFPQRLAGSRRSMPESPTRKTNFSSSGPASTVSVIEIVRRPACLAAVPAKAAELFCFRACPSDAAASASGAENPLVVAPRFGPGPDITLRDIRHGPPTTFVLAEGIGLQGPLDRGRTPVLQRDHAGWVGGRRSGRMSSPGLLGGPTQLGPRNSTIIGNRPPPNLGVVGPAGPTLGKREVRPWCFRSSARARASAARLAPRAKKKTTSWPGPAAKARPPKISADGSGRHHPRCAMSAPRSYRPARAAPLGTKGRAS